MLGFLAIFPWLGFLILAPVIAAQIVLSQKKRRWFWGLILPAISVAASIVLLVVELSTRGTLINQTAGQAIVSVLARVFVYNIATLVLLTSYAVCRLKRTGIKALLIVLMVALTPLSDIYLDGGSVVYAAVLYRITCLHRIDHTQPTGFRTDTIVHVFPMNFLDEMD